MFMWINFWGFCGVFFPYPQTFVIAEFAIFSYLHEFISVASDFNTLSANPKKWSNTLKNFVGKSIWHFRDCKVSWAM